ncbi:MAG: acyl-[acyl-carrier-protein] thioesterase [Bacteroidales bacterium]|nr:acyl-[acyl-carrier-protein] thioesterase [Bacteroidales bacterium]
MQSKSGVFHFKAEAFRCNMLGYLPYQQMGTYMLDAADLHANERNFGMTYLMPRHLAWVLSRFTLEMTDMPRPAQPFEITTWVENTMKFFTSRNFKVTAGDHVLGYGRSIWAMIDTATRQPTNILEVRNGEMMQWVDSELECPIAPPTKFRFGPDCRLERSVETRYSDADINGHINSMRYIGMALDLFGPDWHREHYVRRLDAAYMAESHCGDVLNFYLEEAGDTIGVRIAKVEPATGDETDVCRCSILV